MPAVPGTDTILGWIRTIVEKGDRRPGTEADIWIEGWIAEQFTAMGLSEVRCEDVPVMAWQPGPARVELLDAAGDAVEVLPAIGLPHTRPGQAEGRLMDVGGDLFGAVAVRDYPLPDLPQALVRALATWHYDPTDEFDHLVQRLPFGAESQKVVDPIEAAGAAAFIGLLSDGWWNTTGYYVPYDGEYRDLPCVWLAPQQVERLASARSDGCEQARVVAASERRSFVSHNVMGSLPGASDEWIIVGTHHDGPYLGAVEDASGVAMVLAQAAAWSRVEADDRPHNLLFVAMAAHLTHGAGTRAFIEAHRDLLDQTVLEVHLEHIAAATTVTNGELVPTGEPEPRWWFTSTDPWLEQTVARAITDEDLTRSLVLRPDAFFEIPPTDGGFFHEHGVPLVNLLAAPCYLFVPEDTVDKVHVPSLEPVARAVASIIAATAGQSGRGIRERIR